MAEVLQPPHQSDSQLFRHSSSSATGLHKSASSSFLGSSTLSPPIHAEHNERMTSPPPSITLPLFSEPSIHDSFDSHSSSSSTSGSAISLADKFRNDEDVDFPDYGGTQFYTSQHDLFDASQSSDEPVESITTSTTRSDSPLPTPTVSDDTAIKQPPSRHVDYLSHDWREEDIWSSWRHIVSQRKVYGQRSRLENASWRTWAKSKYHLRTVSPETLNWLKESDVTWLYGPLKPAENHPLTNVTSEPISQLSTRGSFVHKKPILKKRSMSEVMLQKSISASSLLKQAAASVQAQQGRDSRKSALRRAHSEFVSSTFASETPSIEPVDYFTSRSSSNIATPSETHEKRHIRFDDKVEQCIAVECKESEFDEAIESEADADGETSSPESSSDDGIIMMKRKKRPGLKRRGTGSNRGSRTSPKSGPKTIETLPATTLKYRTDSPDVSGEAQHHHTFGKNWSSSGKLSPSPSQETLRPSHPSSNFLLGTDDDGGADAATDSSWSFGASNPKSSLGASSSSEELPTRSRRDERAADRARKQAAAAQAAVTAGPVRDDDYSVEGMRRTNSGMFMPYDEDEDDMMAVGLFGRVSETINTAKDIAHVIWNVGWRK